MLELDFQHGCFVRAGIFFFADDQIYYQCVCSAFNRCEFRQKIQGWPVAVENDPEQTYEP